MHHVRTCDAQSSIPTSRFGFCHLQRALGQLSSRVSYDAASGQKKYAWSRVQGKRKITEAYERMESSFCGFPWQKFRRASPLRGGTTKRKNSSVVVVDRPGLRYSNLTWTHAHVSTSLPATRTCKLDLGLTRELRLYQGHLNLGTTMRRAASLVDVFKNSWSSLFRWNLIVSIVDNHWSSLWRTFGKRNLGSYLFKCKLLVTQETSM